MQKYIDRQLIHKEKLCKMMMNTRVYILFQSCAELCRAALCCVALRCAVPCCVVRSTKPDSIEMRLPGFSRKACLFLSFFFM